MGTVGGSSSSSVSLPCRLCYLPHTKSHLGTQDTSAFRPVEIKFGGEQEHNAARANRYKRATDTKMAMQGPPKLSIMGLLLLNSMFAMWKLICMTQRTSDRFEIMAR